LSSFTSKLVVGVSPSTIVFFVGNLTMGVVSSSVIPFSFVVIPSLGKLAAHDHIFHDKKVV
jgi:hypothetical protein